MANPAPFFVQKRFKTKKVRFLLLNIQYRQGLLTYASFFFYHFPDVPTKEGEISMENKGKTVVERHHFRISGFNSMVCSKCGYTIPLVPEFLL